jgi:hypothetical protein
VLTLVFAFAIGFALARVLESFNESAVFNGKWISLWAGNATSLQMNITTMKISDRAITAWIREDRQTIFLGQTGVVGRTIISKVTLDCAKRLVTVHEQRGFDQYMSPIQQSQLESIALPPIDTMSILSTLVICGPDPAVKAEPKQQFTPI